MPIIKLYDIEYPIEKKGNILNIYDPITNISYKIHHYLYDDEEIPSLYFCNCGKLEYHKSTNRLKYLQGYYDEKNKFYFEINKVRQEKEHKNIKDELILFPNENAQGWLIISKILTQITFPFSCWH